MESILNQNNNVKKYSTSYINLDKIEFSPPNLKNRVEKILTISEDLESRIEIIENVKNYSIITFSPELKNINK